MKAKITLRVEILDGPNAVYMIEEQNRVVDLKRLPYQVTVEFVTPDMYREWRELHHD